MGSRSTDRITFVANVVRRYFIFIFDRDAELAAFSRRRAASMKRSPGHSIKMIPALLKKDGPRRRHPI
jgi:hypothetical protein